MEPQRPSAASRNQNLEWSDISGAKEVLSSSGEPRWVSIIFGVARHGLLGIKDGMNTSLVPTAEPRVSPAFLSKYQPLLQGTLQGFDRLRLRGTLRHLFCPQVMEAYLSACRVLIKDFGRFATGLTQKIKQAGIIAILRGDYTVDDMLRIGKALLAGQVTVMEVTLNSPNALTALPKLLEHFGDRLLIGTGTSVSSRLKPWPVNTSKMGSLIFRPSRPRMNSPGLICSVMFSLGRTS